MFKSSIAILAALMLALPALAQAPAKGNVLEIQENAPDRYVVQKGDTLWGIAQKFFKDPWQWPQIWRLNQDQIRNPHLIFPGNIVRLDRGTMTLSVERLEPQVRIEPLATQAIPTIPPRVIEPFLSRPLVIELDGLKNAPEVVATQEARVNLGTGNRAYVSGIGDSATSVWYVYRQGGPLVDPDTNKTLGYEAAYLGQVRVEKRGPTSTVVIISSQREIGVGDRLLPASEPRVFSYVPRKPEKPIEGRVMSLYDGRSDAYMSPSRVTADPTDQLYRGYDETGALGIISINRGARDGLEVGHVLALWDSRKFERDRSVGPFYMGERKSPTVEIPEERYGLVMVFRVFDSVSYALVMRAERQVVPRDVVRTP